MRKPAAAVAATRAPPPAGNLNSAPEQVVCLALVVALVVLAARIASFW